MSGRKGLSLQVVTACVMFVGLGPFATGFLKIAIMSVVALVQGGRDARVDGPREFGW